MILRLLGVVYAIAFLVAINQIIPLIGENGLTPVHLYLETIQQYYGKTEGVWNTLSLFWFNHSDTMLIVVGWTGFVLSFVVIAGYANAILMFLLWVLYMSFVHVGQVWYGYGWEIQLLETGFFALFLCPLWDARPFPKRPPCVVVIWLFRTLIFRLMLGAGLIKLRSDPVWNQLEALYYHFETQPIPGPLSRSFHFLPKSVLQVAVMITYFVELIVPWFVFWPKLGRHVAGIILVLFQINLILSGNYSFLNWITLVSILACFDDSFFRRILPKSLVERSDAAAKQCVNYKPMQLTCWAVAGLVLILSIPVALNLSSKNQVMNTSYNPFEIVNTYGVFGTVGKERYNIVFEGSNDEIQWEPYLYKGLPVDLRKRPPQIAPYHLRLDWQMWFASMAKPANYPFTYHVIWKLLSNDKTLLSLFAHNPFPDKPPQFVRARYYKYHFEKPGNKEQVYWSREDLGDWLPSYSLTSSALQLQLKKNQWLKE